MCSPSKARIETLGADDPQATRPPSQPRSCGRSTDLRASDVLTQLSPRVAVAVAFASLLSGCGAGAPPPPAATPEVVTPPASPPKVEITESTPLHEKSPASFAWLPSTSTCPADAIPATTTDGNDVPAKCAADLGGCFSRCQSSDAEACYGAALRVQEMGDMEANNPLAEALFLRACKLGVMSGCTNRAAGMMRFDAVSPARDTCVARTFEATCDKRDPWGCTMFGLVLEQGIGVTQDLPRALSVLKYGCVNGIDDPACQNALDVAARIKARSAQGTGSSP